MLLFSAIGRSHLGNPGLEAWQPNVIETLTSFVKRHGLDPGDPQEQALDLVKHLLGEARSHRQRIESFTLGDAGLDETDWLCVAGCQRRSKISPPGRSKTSPLNVMRYALLGGCPGSP